MNLNFRVPPPRGFGGRTVTFHDSLVTLSAPVKDAAVYYSVGKTDTIPTRVYSSPILINGDEVLRAQTILRTGRKSNIATAEFFRVDPGLNGLTYDYYEGIWDTVPDFQKLTPNKSGRTYDIGLELIPHREDNFGVRISGFITLSEGEYTFYLKSDDGSKLYVDGRLLVNNDGLHGARELAGKVRLTGEKHAVEIRYFERDGDQSLSVSVEGKDLPKARVSPRMLTH
jgi:hypothetical protein